MSAEVRDERPRYRSFKRRSDKNANPRRDVKSLAHQAVYGKA